MAPWVRPIYDILYQFISPKEVTQLLEEKIIEISPLGYMRGRTFKNCWVVADEMQNSTVSQMKMLLTRLGENSKMVITGDVNQCDNNENGLMDLLTKINRNYSDKEMLREKEISLIEFTNDDIQRSAIIETILDIYAD